VFSSFHNNDQIIIKQIKQNKKRYDLTSRYIIHHR